MKNPLKSLKNDEKGLASLVISMLIILILTLIVLGMARNAQREQREALDRQLNSQALYAAESGVNDAVEFLTSTNDPAYEENQDNCQKMPGFVGNNQLDPVGPIEYSCVLWNKTPGSLKKDVGIDNSWVVPLSGANSAIGRLRIAWEEKGSPAGISCPGVSATSFPANLPASCTAGFLRAELINTAGSIDRQSLINRNFVAFLVPGTSGAAPTTINYSQGGGPLGGIASQGYVAQVRCSSPPPSGYDKKCVAEITGLNIPREGTGEPWYLRLRSIYKTNSVTITAISPTGASVDFANAQIEIDSTGKASDVLKRINVRVPFNPEFVYPEFALQTNGHICKLMEVLPTNTTATPPCVLD